MRPARALLLAAVAGVVLSGAPAHADEPYDGQLATILVAPEDASFVEVVDPAESLHSGPLPLDVTLTDVFQLPADAATMMRGAYVRRFASPSGVSLAEFGIDQGIGGTALAQLGASSHDWGEPTVVVSKTLKAWPLGGTNPDGTAWSGVWFQVGTRLFEIEVQGASAADAKLLATQAGRVAAAAASLGGEDAKKADQLAGLARAANGSPAVSGTPGTGTPVADDLIGRLKEIVHDRRFEKALGAIALLLGLLLVNRIFVRRRAHRAKSLVTGKSPDMARAAQGWGPGTAAWPTLDAGDGSGGDVAPFPTLGAPSPAPVVAGMAAAPPPSAPAAHEARQPEPVEAYFGNRNYTGWGDEAEPEPEPDALPPLPSRASTPERIPPAGGSPLLGPTTEPAGSPAAAPAPVGALPPRPAAVPPLPVAAPQPAPPGAATPSGFEHAPVAALGGPPAGALPPMAPAVPSAGAPWLADDDQTYSFPGAEQWPAADAWASPEPATAPAAGPPPLPSRRPSS